MKEMRIKAGLSMRKTGALIGKSDSYIAHLETGRMDFPKGEKLDQILAIYGGIKQKSFFEKVRNFSERPNDITTLKVLIERANPEQLSKIIKYMEDVISGII